MTMMIASPAGGLWHERGAWFGGVVPGPDDDVHLAYASGNVTAVKDVAIRSLTFRDYSGTFTMAAPFLRIFGTRGAKARYRRLRHRKRRAPRSATQG